MLSLAPEEQPLAERLMPGGGTLGATALRLQPWPARAEGVIILDYAFQAHNTLKQQRMSKEEVKQEYKDAEGDPYMKRRPYEMQHEIQSGSLAHNVKRSAVVIRNPTHIAICLGYHPKICRCRACWIKVWRDVRAKLLTWRNAPPCRLWRISPSRGRFSSMSVTATEYRKRCFNRLRHSCAWCWYLTMNVMKKR